jgi:TorA maturation chaperone TorD
MIDELDRARARLYRLLGAALAAPPDAALLRLLAGLDGDGSELGAALRALAAAAADSTVASAAAEYGVLFVGIVRGEVLPYASFYQTGFLYDRPLAAVRADMQRLGLAPAPGRADPEDHIATICELMACVIESEPDEQRGFFTRHIDPWAGRLFAEIEASASAMLYRPVGTLGRLLVEIDRHAFMLEPAT